MKNLTRLFTLVTHPPLGEHLLAARRPCRGGTRDERGDVPGWVLVTVMSAGLVAALGVLAGDQLRELLSAAFAQVRGTNW